MPEQAGAFLVSVTLFSLLEGSPLPLHLLGFCILQNSRLLGASDTFFILLLTSFLVCCHFSVRACSIVWSRLWAPWNWPVPCLSLYFPSCQVLHGPKGLVKVVLHKCLLIDKLTNMHPPPPARKKRIFHILLNSLKGSSHLFFGHFWATMISPGYSLLIILSTLSHSYIPLHFSWLMASPWVHLILITLMVWQNSCFN